MLEVIFVAFGLILMLFFDFLWLNLFFLMILSGVFISLEMNYEMVEWHVNIEGLGNDLFSVSFVFLSLWVSMLMVLGQSKISKDKASGSISLFVFIYFFLLVVFVSMDYMSLYLAFEAVLFPTVMLIFGWGYQPERLGAGLYLLLYTVFCSLPLLLMIIWVWMKFGIVWGFILGSCLEKVGVMGGVMVIASVIGFLVSVPLYGLHLWLPSAHVEAPVSGSMILAGVLLKLGGYGLMRFSQWGWVFMKKVSGFFISVSLVGGIYLCLVCLRQIDLSSLVAYSSVVHMGLVVGGLFSGFNLGIVGGVVMMIGHGLCSSGMFYYSGMSYERLGSRSLMLNKGLMIVFPSSVLFWFLFVSSNMAAPPSLNLLGELMLLGGILGWSGWLTMILMVVSFFSGVYCLYLFGWVQHGEGSILMKGGEGLMVMEGMVCILHWFPLNILFMKSDLFSV